MAAIFPRRPASVPDGSGRPAHAPVGWGWRSCGRCRRCRIALRPTAGLLRASRTLVRCRWPARSWSTIPTNEWVTLADPAPYRDASDRFRAALAGEQPQPDRVVSSGDAGHASNQDFRTAAANLEQAHSNSDTGSSRHPQEPGVQLSLVRRPGTRRRLPGPICLKLSPNSMRTPGGGPIRAARTWLRLASQRKRRVGLQQRHPWVPHEKLVLGQRSPL